MKTLKYKNSEGELKELYNIYNPFTKDKLQAVAGDIVMFDGSDKYILKNTEEETLQAVKNAGHTPVGVVVIPTSHDIYGTGEGAMMSLNPMSASNPDNGYTTEEQPFIGWGPLTDTSLYNYNSIGVISNNNSSNPSIYRVAIDSTSPIYFPVSNSDGEQVLHDPKAYYPSYKSGSYVLVPSPYDIQEKRNLQYCLTGYCTSDFNGKTNTEVLCSLATEQEDWKTADKISQNSSGVDNNDTRNYYPAACCCWRYHTEGTNQGDWYLPAMGELGYIMARLTIIENTINLIKSNWDIGKNFSSYIWSSTEMDQTRALFVSTTRGELLTKSPVTYDKKTYDRYVVGGQNYVNYYAKEARALHRF